MFKKLFKCPICNSYSLDEHCKKCKVKTINPAYKYKNLKIVKTLNNDLTNESHKI